MTSSQALILYRPSTATSSLTFTSYPSSGSLVSARLFTTTTGTAIATELLYRILLDIINRLLTSLQRFASSRLDRFSSYLERKRLERQQQQRLQSSERAKGHGGLGIVEEVSKLAQEEGFITCPMTGTRSEAFGAEQRGPRPLVWVRGVMAGIQEGRLEEMDFWVNNHVG